MLKIRLQRIGRRNDPAFRVVVTESTQGPRSGKYVELLGSYNPRQGVRSFKADRIKHWISEGAQTSDTVHNLLVQEKIIEGTKINVLPKKSPIKSEQEEQAAEAPTEAPAAEGGEETAEAPTTEETASEETPTETPAEEKEEEQSAETSTEEASEEEKPQA